MSAFVVSACVPSVEVVLASGVTVCVSTAPDFFVSVVELTGVLVDLAVSVVWSNVVSLAVLSVVVLATAASLSVAD
ncbi:hypothetical protein [Companilactobacillus kimchii]|uniref:hypothetical protein n=1 Tax=Companilactobacillus kimchii TaxID=2801452 RepID=UPI0012E3069A|nr:hypothetical protein [Companilactobacillus kimchii]